MVPTMTCAMLEQEIIMLRLLIKEAVEALESAMKNKSEPKPPKEEKPLIPICQTCKKPFTQCQCEHNKLVKNK